MFKFHKGFLSISEKTVGNCGYGDDALLGSPFERNCGKMRSWPIASASLDPLHGSYQGQILLPDSN